MNFSLVKKLLSGVVLLALGTQVHAQTLGDTLVTVGTCATNTLTGQRCAVVVWQPIPATLVAGKKFAVYSKPGEATNASSYTRRTITGLTTDPLVVAPLLNRAAGLGDNLATLEDHIGNLFAALMPSNSVSLSERIAVVIAGAQADARNLDSLAALGRIHLALNSCLGRAYVETITNTTTFEVREFDTTRGVDVGVVGRVTVNPATTPQLAAPGAPVALPETGSYGHLNAKLRWAVPSTLRRDTLLQYGFNVFCVPRAVAEINGWQSSSPSATVLRANPATRVVNYAPSSGEIPVLAAKLFSNLDVADFYADAKTHFIADDNNGTRGGAGFHDGEQVYYFVTARDILGRDGLVSPGTLVTLCSKVPPAPPLRVHVDNGMISTVSVGAFPTTNTEQRLRIHWRVPNTATNSYWCVYRWSDSKNIAVNGLNPTNNRIAGPLLVTNLGSDTYVVDDGVDAPTVQSDAGKTFWYTVREAENTACGLNFSAHSAPAFGVLRDRTGPEAPVGGVTFNCCHPSIFNNDFGYAQASGQHPADEYWFRYVVSRSSSDITWADFSYYFYHASIETNGSFGRVNFPANVNSVTNWLRLPVDYFSGWQTSYVSLSVSVKIGGPNLPDEPSTFFNEYVDLQEAGAQTVYAASFSAQVECGEATVQNGGGCLRVQNGSTSIVPIFSATNPAPVNYSFFGYDPYHGAKWVDVFLNGTDSTNRIKRITPGQFGLLNWVFETNANIFTDPYTQPQFILRAGGIGTISDDAYIYLYQRPSSSNEAVQISFSIATNCIDGPGGGIGGPIRGGGNNCTRHTPSSGGGAAPVTLEPIKTWFWLTDTAEEWRVYRSIDDGPIQLIKQGLASYKDVLTVTNSDSSLPANAGTACYFAQLLDEHGNPSPMSSLGCVDIAPAQSAPAPMLAPIESAGSAIAPQMKLSWFCPPAGVDRFEVCIAAAGQSPAPNVGAEVTPDYATMSNPQTVTLTDGTSVSQNFGFYQTSKATILGGGSAQFTRTVNVQSDVKYYVFVRSVLADGGHSPFSNVGEFTFVTPPPVIPPGVAWPQRPLPNYNTNLFSNVRVWPLLVKTLNTNTALLVTNVGTATLGYEIVVPAGGLRWVPGVQIGTFPAPPSDQVKTQVFVYETHYVLGQNVALDFAMTIHSVIEQMTTNASSLIFKDGNGKSVFSCVLYRTQVPNFYYPRVSGDIIQCSPMISGIASAPYHPGTVLLADPFIEPYLFHMSSTVGNDTASYDFRGLFLLDTQPRLVNADYAYMLVRFNEFGEVRDVLPCGLYTEPVQ